MEATGDGCTAVSYDGASFLVHGRRVLILSGSVHYPRVHPSRWEALFASFREARLNTIETYVFWGEHYVPPTEPGGSPTYDFSGRRDLFGFLRAAQKAGLHAILRIGPYVCAEVSYGGFPFALRDVPGMRFRTLNKPFQDAVSEWTRYVAAQLHEQKLLAPAGGPVMLVQLENEYQMVSGAYGDDGAKYLQWCSDLQHELDFGVPTIMCFGAAEGAVETINSFYAHELIGALRKSRPSQPAVWTECWTGWYDVWGAPHHKRCAKDLAYSVARFFAAGGGGNNYYMWLGGTNFGRTPMYLQATSYDYDAPIDEFYLPTTKSRHLSALHSVLLDQYAPLLFQLGESSRGGESENGSTPGVPVPGAQEIDKFVKVYQWSKALVFVCNDSKTESSQDFPVPGSDYRVLSLPPLSVRIVNPEAQSVLFDSHQISADLEVHRKRKPVRLPSGTTEISDWSVREEPLTDLNVLDGGNNASRGVASGDKPPEQLRLSRDMTDYCFYSATYKWASDDAKNDAIERGILLNMDACDYVYAYINGVYCGKSEEPLWEDRKNNTWNRQDGMPGFLHSLKGSLLSSMFGEGDEFTVTLLVCSLGLVKGDWQLGDGQSANMLEEKKGLLSDVTLTCAACSSGSETDHGATEAVIAAGRQSQWTAVAGLVGEASEWATSGLGNEAIGTTSPKPSRATEKWQWGAHPVWLEATVEVPSIESSWVLDLGGMGKGLLWVNGCLLGRYWSVAGTRPRNGFLDGAPITQDEPGPPTQRYYHIPPWVVSRSPSGPTTLRVTLFEERGVNPVSAGISLFYVE